MDTRRQVKGEPVELCRVVERFRQTQHERVRAVYESLLGMAIKRPPRTAKSPGQVCKNYCTVLGNYLKNGAGYPMGISNLLVRPHFNRLPTAQLPSCHHKTMCGFSEKYARLKPNEVEVLPPGERRRNFRKLRSSAKVCIAGRRKHSHSGTRRHRRWFVGQPQADSILMPGKNLCRTPWRPCQPGLDKGH